MSLMLEELDEDVAQWWSDISDEVLFDLLAGCKHSTVVRVPGDDPKAYEAMDDWNGRVNFARRIHELYRETFPKDKLANVDSVVARQYGLDYRYMRRFVTLGWVLSGDPELGCRLAGSDVPWTTFFHNFTWDRYKRIKDRLHEAWGTTKRGAATQ